MNQEIDKIMIDDLILWAENTKELYDLQLIIFKESIGLDEDTIRDKLFKQYWPKAVRDYEKNCMHDSAHYTPEDLEYFMVEQISRFENYLREWKLVDEHLEMKHADPCTRVIRNSVLKGTVLKLPPGQLERDLYLDVKNKLELIGGVWKGGKIAGFVFPQENLQFLEDLKKGVKKNLKKEFQFFGTCPPEADYLVELSDIQPTDKVLEPHAGQGAIVKAIHRATTAGRKVYGYELMPLNQNIVSKIEGFELLGEDFLTNLITFDKIIANPPFTNNQDIDHIYKMYESLNPKGRLATIASTHWEHSNNKKETAFREWLDERKAYIEKVPAGAFKDSGTNIETRIIVINKPAADKKMPVAEEKPIRKYIQPSLF